MRVWSDGVSVCLCVWSVGSMLARLFLRLYVRVFLSSSSYVRWRVSFRNSSARFMCVSVLICVCAIVCARVYNHFCSCMCLLAWIFDCACGSSFKCTRVCFCVAFGVVPFM